MNKMRKTALLASLGLGLVALSASAANTYNPGDLVLGMRASGSQDLLVDLGSFSQYDAGARGGSSASFTPTAWSSSYLSSTFSGGPSTVTWSVFGALKDSGTGSTATAPDGSTLTHDTLWASAAGPGSSPWVVQSVSAQRASQVQVSALGNEYQTTGTSLSSSAKQVSPSDTASYTTINGNGDLNGTFQGSIEMTGAGTLDLYELANPATQSGQNALFLGSFVLGANDSLTFVPVPEASTYGLIAAAGLLALSLRRQLSRNNA
jgi:hypothetical protein